MQWVLKMLAELCKRVYVAVLELLGDLCLLWGECGVKTWGIVCCGWAQSRAYGDLAQLILGYIGR